MKSLWNEGKVSIVLFPSRELYDSVFVEMKKWTEDGLINHALWVFPENIEELELQPANIKSLVCGKNKDGVIETIEVDLFDQLARGEFEQVRLVAVRVLNDSLEVSMMSTITSVSLPMTPPLGTQSPELAVYALNVVLTTFAVLAESVKILNCVLFATVIQ